MKTAADVVVQVLADAGVKYVFGISGDSVLALIDAIGRTPGITYMPVLHEQVGTGMADGYTRVTGDPGVVLGHMGPGVCNLVIGLAAAYRDSSPIIALTGVREGKKIGRDAWHEIDQLGILRPITKWGVRITSADSAARVTRTALTLALGGRPGPVHIELPKDIARVESSVESGSPLSFAAIREAVRVGPNPALVSRALDMLLSARRPLILAGGGVHRSGASAALLAFAEAVAVPVATSSSGRGAIPEDHPLCAGPVGQYGTPFGSEQLKQADVLLAVGCRFSDVATRDWSLVSAGAKIVHVDIDPKELGRQYEEALSMVADAKLFFDAALGEAGKHGKTRKGSLESDPRVAELIKGREADLKAFFDPSANSNVPGRPQLWVKEIAAVLKRDAIVTVGAGLYARFAGRVPAFMPGSYLKSLGLGALGWAFPAALGAKLGQPSRQVVCMLGDGDFLTVIQDLLTAVREKIPVAVVVFNDNGYGSIRELQKREFGGRVVGSDYPTPPFDELARVMGALGLRAGRPEEAGPALGKILESGKPGVLEIPIGPQGL